MSVFGTETALIAAPVRKVINQLKGELAHQFAALRVPAESTK